MICLNKAALHIFMSRSSDFRIPKLTFQLIFSQDYTKRKHYDASSMYDLNLGIQFLIGSFPHLHSFNCNLTLIVNKTLYLLY